MYYEVHISAEDQDQADTIMNSLLSQKLVTGGQFLTSPARFIWKNKIVDMNYITITAFTMKINQQKIIENIKRTSVEEVPMIRFIKLEYLNNELENWIANTLETNK